MQHISLEQGDVNQSQLRQAYHNQFDGAAKALIKEDAAVYLH